MTIRLGVRERVAIRALRSVNRLSRMARRGSGTVAGGRVGLRIAPGLLTTLATGRTVIVVSGTNGKTTTTAMTAVGWGGPVVSNATGANMPPGHAAALVASNSPRVVLEVDEAWLAAVVDATRPRVCVLLNLSRDQLDRANEVRHLAERWRTMLGDVANADLVVVANANDPLVVYAAEVSRHVRWCDVPVTWLADAVSCPKCTSALEHGEGLWRCRCGFARPVAMATTLDEELVVGDHRIELTLALPGQFNRANAAMALCALAIVGVDLDAAASRIGEITSVAGRFAERQWGGHCLQLLLAKNPAGFAAMLETVTADERDVWVAINARVADGRDPSWLYDVPFEMLRGHRVYCFGDRRLDVATRLDYAKVEYIIVDDDAAVPTSANLVPVLANYTAFSDWLACSS